MFAAIAVLALGIGGVAGWVNERLGAQLPRLDAATALLDQAKPVPRFSLVDDQGRAFDNARLDGRWSFMFFGYTHCPDICPATLSTLNTAMRAVGKQGGAADTQVVFVSVDPRRDTPATLEDYVKFFNPAFTGVTGSQRELIHLTRELGIIHTTLSYPQGADNYLVDHSASILLIDPEGKLAAVFSVPHRAQTIASDFHKLRSYYDERG
ncbi:MAG: SCO family protein [Gammaproteobacteria bacterium]